MPSLPLAAAIVAGGRARRFNGQDKSRLVVQGRTIIVRQMDVLQRLTSEVFIVANERDRFADLNVPVYPDRWPGTGTVGAIATALAAATSDRVITVAGDLPFLSEALLRALAELAADRDGAWIRTQRGAEPLIACYQRASLGAITDAISRGDLKAADLDRRLNLAEMDEDTLARFGRPDELLANVNTPDDYARIQ